MTKFSYTCFFIICYLLNTGLTMAQTDQWEYTGGPCYSGEINDIVYDPTDPDVIFIALFDRYAEPIPGLSGVYKSTNSGHNWQDVLSTTLVFNLAINPENPLFIYADHWRSTDGGESWEEMSDLPLEMVELFIDPVQPNIVYAGTLMDGLWRSTDRGDSWQQFADLAGAIETIAIHPVHTDTIFVGSDNQGIYRTFDGGLSWDNIPLNLEDLAFDPVNPTIMFAATVEGSIVKSINFFDSWASLGLTEMRTIALNPANPQELYAGGDGIYHSIDGGNTWDRIDGVLTGYSKNVTAISIIPDQSVFLGTEACLYYKQTRQDRWRPRDPKLQTSRIRDFEKAGDVLYATTLFGLTYLINGDWYINGFRYLRDWPAIDIEVCPDSTNIMFAVLHHDAMFDLLYRTNDRGNTWANVPEINQYGNDIPIDISPSEPNVIYAGKMRSIDYGQTWQVMNGLIDNTYLEPSNYIVHPDSSEVIYAILYRSAELSGLYKTSNSGETWRFLGSDDFSTLGLIDLDPINPNVIYLSRRGEDGGIYKSTDYGQNWFIISEDLPDLTSASSFILSIHPINSENLFAGTYHDGVFTSSNGGETWLPLSTNLPDYDYGGIQVFPDTTWLYAGYYGEEVGVYRYELQEDTLSVVGGFEQKPPVTQPFISNYPNPFREHTMLSFHLPQATDVNVSIYNMIGQRVTTFHEDYLESGDHLLPWNGLGQNGQRVSSGMYFYRVETNQFVHEAKMIFLH